MCVLICMHQERGESPAVAARLASELRKESRLREGLEQDITLATQQNTAAMVLIGDLKVALSEQRQRVAELEGQLLQASQRKEAEELALQTALTAEQRVRHAEQALRTERRRREEAEARAGRLEREHQAALQAYGRLATGLQTAMQREQARY